MRFSILHLSDLHRDLNDQVDNPWLLESLVRDAEQYGLHEPRILSPSLCIVSGDLVYGVNPKSANSDVELARQYEQAETFLVELADRFFNGDRERVVILPGNHDVNYADVIASAAKIEIPLDPAQRAQLVAELFSPRSALRWSWSELCFWRIKDQDRYRARLQRFSEMYERFYFGKRKFSLDPGEQTDTFDFPELGFAVLTLNSCYDNDPLRRAGAFHPTAVARTGEVLRESHRSGWLIAAAWHHNLSGGPARDDYLDIEILQLLIQVGVSLGFHGHQHRTECIDERYRIGPGGRKITIVSAGTLCAGPRYLVPGIPRGYNVIEIDTDGWKGRLHLRQMVNGIQSMPVWGPGLISATNQPYVDFDLCQPLRSRPQGLDIQLTLERAERLVGARAWDEATRILEPVREEPLARPLLAKALQELGDARRTISALWPPSTPSEAVVLGGALLDAGTREEAQVYVELQYIREGADASVRDIVRRIRERLLK